MAQQIIEALYADGTFRPRDPVDLAPGSVVRIELKEVLPPQSAVNLDAAYSALDEKYPAANVRAVYRDRAELHER